MNTVEGKLIDRDLFYFKKGDYLFKEGEVAEGFYCVYEGSVKISNKNNGEELPWRGTLLAFIPLLMGILLILQ